MHGLIDPKTFILKFFKLNGLAIFGHDCFSQTYSLPATSLNMDDEDFTTNDDSENQVEEATDFNLDKCFYGNTNLNVDFKNGVNTYLIGTLK